MFGSVLFRVQKSNTIYIILPGTCIMHVTAFSSTFSSQKLDFAECVGEREKSTDKKYRGKKKYSSEEEKIMKCVVGDSPLNIFTCVKYARADTFFNLHTNAYFAFYQGKHILYLFFNILLMKQMFFLSHIVAFLFQAVKKLLFLLRSVSFCPILHWETINLKLMNILVVIYLFRTLHSVLLM